MKLCPKCVFEANRFLKVISCVNFAIRDIQFTEMANCLELDIRNKNVYVRLYNVIDNMEMRLDTIEKYIVSSYDSIKTAAVMSDSSENV